MGTRLVVSGLILWLGASRVVGMYLRTTQRRNKDGSVVRYVQLAHNRRVEGVTQAEVLLNLAREDGLDRDALVRLVASINRYLGEPAPAGVPADEAMLVGDGLRVTESRPMGTAYLLDALWRQLGVDTALRKVLGPRRFSTDVERVLFALVANRAIDPISKLAAAEWVTQDVAIPGLETMDEDQTYRAMDLLVQADAQAGVQEAVFFAVADLLNLEDFLWFFFGMCFPEPHSTKQVEDCVQWGLDTSPEVLAAEARAAGPSKSTVEEWCRAVATPVLAVHGDHDRVSPTTRGERVAEPTGGACVVLEGAGHIPLARHPVRINLLIRDFARQFRAQG